MLTILVSILLYNKMPLEIQGLGDLVGLLIIYILLVFYDYLALRGWLEL